MINFNYETDFKFLETEDIIRWIETVVKSEGYKLGDINYVFCDDDYLHKLNTEFLDHDTLTDIISFDYSVGKELHGDIFVSIERVRENAVDFNVDFDNELRRVMIHGILHYCGYNDKNTLDKKEMRDKENVYLKLLNGNS